MECVVSAVWQGERAAVYCSGLVGQRLQRCLGESCDECRHAVYNFVGLGLTWQIQAACPVAPF